MEEMEECEGGVEREREARKESVNNGAEEVVGKAEKQRAEQGWMAAL